MDICYKERFIKLLELFIQTRKDSLYICERLNDEDLQAQSMPDASPLKWHLAHTTWAFETFVLKPHSKNYQVFDSDFEYLFNSYYNAIGEQFPRAQRGLLTRPDRETVLKYRFHVDQAIINLIESMPEKAVNSDCYNLIQLSINHEQQHQELMLTDLKHLLFINPIYPAYRDIEHTSNCSPSEPVTFEAGLYTIGHENEAFYFDNEGPQHSYYLTGFKLDSHLVSNAEYMEFIQDGGYHDASHWLSEAWQKINADNIRQPYYWVKQGKQWCEYSLNGLQPLAPLHPVKHISYFEASAYASWKKKRLPTEQEWEVASRSNNPDLKQMFGQLWQWTSSSYNAYPGFKPNEGAVGEYNGKFMVNQYVLKGGSVVTPAGHIRPSYRNFFYPDARWQYTGIRLAH